MADPRVQKWMADPRVMRAVMSAVSFPDRFKTSAASGLTTFAKSLDLATDQEVKDLRRTVRRLEEEIARLRLSSAKDRA